MRSILSVLFIILLAQTSSAQRPLSENLKEGDIIFQYIPCGDLCQAIIETTPCQPGKAFNHCGIIHKNGNAVYVIEAIGKQVKETPLDTFLKREKNEIVTVGRVRISKGRKHRAVTKAEQYKGVPYDDEFLPGDNALYCSELVWEAYKDPKGKPFFQLAPMTFKSPATGTTYPAWTAYYADLHAAIPEGLPGINPCAIANSPLVELFEFDR